MAWHKLVDEKIRKALRHFYYEKGLLSFNYYEAVDSHMGDCYMAYINKKYVTWKKDLEYIIDYCKRNDIKVETHEENNRIYFKFEV